MISRIAEFIDSLHISIRAFEQQINASNGLIRKAIANKTDIQSKWLVIIAENFPQLDMNWLVTGRGSMIRSEKESSTADAISTTTSFTISDSPTGEAAAYFKMYEKKDEENKILIAENSILKERLRLLEKSSLLSTHENPDNTGSSQKATMLPVNLPKKEKISEL